ncbi:DUF3592 domain-containing protein [Flavobacterium hibisci]|uniref:DUF3592 domain-containing protein n=1 Tax=Flavobacterium hibisci TaxID=1914462 RepID=UPI001CBF6467|nr:DUF3592 domain-containing protein [Flavobacterium hibisci]MBZ4042169.1 DUF3592 domain-containing protein [Flavobacterium hibisci]
MKNSISIMKYVFCVIGLTILTQVFFIYQEKKAFVEKADVVRGIVLDGSTDKTFASFITKEGKQIKFYSHNNFLSYDEGESVEVLFDPENPNKAEINSFDTLYLGVSVLGFIGSVFFLTGFLFFRSDDTKQKKIKFLKQGGKQIATKFIDVQLNLSTTVNDSHPYFICSEWEDIKTNKKYFFESDDIWFDPTEYLKTDEIKVLIDPKNPERYYMDISFLPIPK